MTMTTVNEETKVGQYFMRHDGYGHTSGPAFRVANVVGGASPKIELVAVTSLTKHPHTGRWEQLRAIVTIDDNDGKWYGPLSESQVERVTRDQVSEGGARL